MKPEEYFRDAEPSSAEAEPTQSTLGVFSELAQMLLSGDTLEPRMSFADFDSTDREFVLPKDFAKSSHDDSFANEFVGTSAIMSRSGIEKYAGEILAEANRIRVSILNAPAIDDKACLEIITMPIMVLAKTPPKTEEQYYQTATILLKRLAYLVYQSFIVPHLNIPRPT